MMYEETQKKIKEIALRIILGNSRRRSLFFIASYFETITNISDCAVNGVRLLSKANCSTESVNDDKIYRTLFGFEPATSRREKSKLVKHKREQPKKLSKNVHPQFYARADGCEAILNYYVKKSTSYY